jgi:hypothetical protein
VGFSRYTEYSEAVQSFAAALDAELPKLRERHVPATDTAGFTVVSMGGDAHVKDGLWDDEHMANFYTNLPDLAAVVPSMALARGKRAGDAETGSAMEDVATLEREGQENLDEGEGDVERSDEGDGSQGAALSAGAVVTIL